MAHFVLRSAYGSIALPLTVVGAAAEPLHRTIKKKTSGCSSKGKKSHAARLWGDRATPVNNSTIQRRNDILVIGECVRATPVHQRRGSSPAGGSGSRMP